MRPRSALALALGVILAASAARAECDADLSVNPVAPKRGTSPYADEATYEGWAPVRWFDDDRRVLTVYLRASLGAPATPNELQAMLIDMRLLVLAPSFPVQEFVDVTPFGSALLLDQATARSVTAVDWRQVERRAWEDGTGVSHVIVTMELSSASTLADGTYWLVAAAALPQAVVAACPGAGRIFSFPIRLHVQRAITPKERAFVHYRRIQQILELRATDERNPDYRKASPEQHAREIDAALDSAKKLVDVDPNSSFGWEMLAKVHEVRHEAMPALAAYRKALQLLAAGVPDIAATEVRGCMADWRTPPRPAQLQQRIDALSLPQPSFSDPP